MLLYHKINYKIIRKVQNTLKLWLANKNIHKVIREKWQVAFNIPNNIIIILGPRYENERADEMGAVERDPDTPIKFVISK